MKNVMTGKYPMARFLYIYINKEPGKPMDPLVREFLKFVFSREGQQVVVKDGYLPLPYTIVKQELALYRQLKIPVPRRSPEQRHKDRRF